MIRRRKSEANQIMAAQDKNAKPPACGAEELKIFMLWKKT
jgi:hypothetical protein